jgi:hypothetical protein
MSFSILTLPKITKPVITYQTIPKTFQYSKSTFNFSGVSATTVIQLRNNVKAKCIFPFKFDNVLYRACTKKNKTAPWCPTKLNISGWPLDDEDGFWGFCEKDDPLDLGNGFKI